MIFCTYCREAPATDRDHVIPSSRERVKKTFRQKDTVPSCSECNRLLSNLNYFTVRSRAEYLLTAYKKRHRDLLIMPHWSQEELDELGYTLRTAIELKVELKNILLAKLCGLELTVLTSE